MLAAKLGILIGQLPSKLGISRASLFAYRAGKSSISRKAWNKLERVERESGIAPSLAEQIESANPERKNALLASASPAELLTLLPAEDRQRIASKLLEAQLENYETELIGFLLDAQALADLVKQKGSSRSELKHFAEAINNSVSLTRTLIDSLLYNLRSAVGLDTRTVAERLKQDRVTKKKEKTFRSKRR